MKNKVNIAELLKDCPKGMELDCPIFEGLEFDHIDEKNRTYSIVCRVKTEFNSYNFHTFTEYGCYRTEIYSKCVIFPKNKTTWEGFHRPFKDGDIAISESGDIHLLKTSSSSYCAYRDSWEILPKFDSTITTNVTIVRLATEEEKEKLFKAIKENGYKWNPKTKTLEKLNKPRFKVGDEVLWNYNTEIPRVISKVELTSKRGYVYWIDCDGCSSGWWAENELTPIPNKFDITTLKPFDKVLVRNKSNEVWTANFYSHYDATSDKPFICVGWSEMNEYRYCIPYEVNNELLGTTNNTEEYGSR